MAQGVRRTCDMEDGGDEQHGGVDGMVSARTDGACDSRLHASSMRLRLRDTDAGGDYHLVGATAGTGNMDGAEQNPNGGDLNEAEDDEEEEDDDEEYNPDDTDDADADDDAEDDIDDDDDDEDEDDEDDLFSDPIPGLDEFFVFRQVLLGLQTRDPASFAALTGGLDGDARRSLDALMAEAVRRETRREAQLRRDAGGFQFASVGAQAAAAAAPSFDFTGGAPFGGFRGT